VTRTIPTSVALLAAVLVPTALALTAAGRIGSTGGEGLHILAAQIPPDPGYPELRQLPDPASGLPVALFRLLGSDLVALRTVQVLSLAASLALLLLTVRRRGVSGWPFFVSAALIATQFFLVCAFSLALVRYGLALLALAAGAFVGSLRRGSTCSRPGNGPNESNRPGVARLTTTAAGGCFALAVVLCPALLFCIPALLHGRGRGVGSPARLLALVCALPLLLLLIPRVNLPGLERILFGTGGGSLAPFLGLDAGILLSWLADGPQAIASGFLFLFAVLAMPVGLISGLLGAEGGVPNPILLLASAAVLLHPVVLVVLGRLGRLPPSLSGHMRRHEVLCALLAGFAVWLFFFSRAQEVVALAMLFPPLFVLSFVLLLGELAGLAGASGMPGSPAFVNPDPPGPASAPRLCGLSAALRIGGGVWVACTVFELARGMLLLTGSLPPAMSLPVQQELVAAVTELAPPAGHHTHAGEETTFMFELLSPSLARPATPGILPDRGNASALRVRTTEMPGSNAAQCPQGAIPFPSTGPVGFCLEALDSSPGLR
jgi:hypothetical protein